jgi:hypothetical protein
LIDWNEPKKLGGKVERVDVGGPITDISFSGVEGKLLGVATSSGVYFAWSVYG